MVRAKFECVKNTAGQIHLQAVRGGSKENEEFFSATPSGQVQLLVVSPPAAAQFVVGKSYFVDFNDADAQTERERAIREAVELSERELAKGLADKAQTRATEQAPPPLRSKLKGP